MNFKISRDKAGKPVHVSIDDGFCHQSRPYDEEKDGWMERQLDPSEFVAIQIGQDTEYLVNLANSLLRKNYDLEQQLKMWKRAGGF